MGKKGSWFSAIKRVFTHHSKDKPTDKNNKEKKKGKGILRHGGETKSKFPLFRKPSSIEDILGEADQLLFRPHASLEQPKAPADLIGSSSSPKAISPRAASPKAVSPRAASPKAVSARRTYASEEASSSGAAPAATAPKVTDSGKKISHVPRPEPTLRDQHISATEVTDNGKKISHVPRPEPTLRDQHISATKIQAAYRGYLARKSFGALRGLVRLQELVRGQNVKRQTNSAMKQMQLLVRVQSQIQSRRIQMLENEAVRRQNDKEIQSTLSKWKELSEAGQNGDWDDSLLTKEEEEARLQKKVEAVIKRERAMAYAYSHQLWKAKADQSASDMRSNGFPWWWNWLERQLPPASTSQTQSTPKKFTLTPPRPISENKVSPLLHSGSNGGPHTPRSSSSAIPLRNKQFQTPKRSPKYSRPDVPLNDNDSLVSCPPFSVRNYMTPTVSAKAKARANSNPRERVPGTPGSDTSRRSSFPFTTNAGSSKWNYNRGITSSKDKHDQRSIGDMSMDSTISMPAIVGRKPFNRFV